MPRSPHPTTRTTRDAANVAAAAVVVYTVLWLLSTQVKDIRAFSPFADDPWDGVATYSAIFLPFVAGATWIRSLRHRSPLLPAATASRIRWGSGLAAAIVLLAAGVDAQAILALGFPSGAGAIAPVLTVLVALSAVLAAGGLALTLRASRIAVASTPQEGIEPDVVDDAFGLAGELAGVVGLGRPVERLTSALEGFLDGSPISPRRHRVAFGLVLALAVAIAFDAWHAIREGPWAQAWVPVLFGSLISAGILAAYFGTLVPLRLLRPVDGNR
jgi:hypothetical protein